MGGATPLSLHVTGLITEVVVLMVGETAGLEVNHAVGSLCYKFIPYWMSTLNCWTISTRPISKDSAFRCEICVDDPASPLAS